MSARSQLGAADQHLESQHKLARKMFKEDRFEEANNLSQQMLLKPDISDFHKAGFHTVLAHSPDQA